jgi:hypothetical protein
MRDSRTGLTKKHLEAGLQLNHNRLQRKNKYGCRLSRRSERFLLPFSVPAGAADVVRPGLGLRGLALEISGRHQVLRLIKRGLGADERT